MRIIEAGAVFWRELRNGHAFNTHLRLLPEREGVEWLRGQLPVEDEQVQAALAANALQRNT